MATQRYISTSFWDDPWVQELDPSEKFVYMYLLTNPLTTISGIYEITVRRIMFDTGYNTETIERVLARFEKAGKAFYYEKYIILPSWPKHQKWEKSPKIKAGIESDLKKLPDNIKKYSLSIGYQYPLNYSDLDTDIDIDKDTDIDIDSNCEATQEMTGSDFIESAKKHWNSKDNLEPCNLSVFSFGQDTGLMANRIKDYGLDYVTGAIDKLSLAWDSIEYKYRPKSYHRFILGNVEYWANYEAKPGSAKTTEQIDEELKEIPF